VCGRSEEDVDKDGYEAVQLGFDEIPEKKPQKRARRSLALQKEKCEAL
jgi:hypothetical protein